MPTNWSKEIHDERRFLSEFIDVYKSLPALWDSKKKIYYDRQKKADAYEILVKKYREKYPDATREDVTKKINGFRSNYRNGLRKYYKSLKSAKNKDLVPKPSLWYFKKFSFLKLSFGNLDINMDTSVIDGTLNHFRNFDVDAEPIVDKSDTTITNGIDNNSLTSLGISVKQELEHTNYNESDSHENVNYNESDSNENVNNTETEMESHTQSVRDQGDEYYHWAMALAADIRKMYKTQQIYAKKAIAEVVMEGQLGLLHRNSIKITENPL